MKYTHKTTFLAYSLVLGLISPLFCLAYIDAPDSLEEAGNMIWGAIKAAFQRLPGILADLWQNRVIPVWRVMWNWFLDNIWSKFPWRDELRKRTEIIKNRFAGEKAETEQEAPALWDRLKNLLK